MEAGDPLWGLLKGPTKRRGRRYKYSKNVLFVPNLLYMIIFDIFNLLSFSQTDHTEINQALCPDNDLVRTWSCV